MSNILIPVRFFLRNTRAENGYFGLFRYKFTTLPMQLCIVIFSSAKHHW